MVRATDHYLSLRVFRTLHVIVYLVTKCVFECHYLAIKRSMFMARRPAAYDLIDDMNVNQLIQLRSHIDNLITEKRTVGRQRLIDTLKAEAAKEGFEISDLFGYAPKGRRGRKPGKIGKSADVKYRHPTDPSLTWSGRGRPSRWLTELVNKGHKREEFAV